MSFVAEQQIRNTCKCILLLWATCIAINAFARKRKSQNNAFFVVAFSEKRNVASIHFSKWSQGTYVAFTLYLLKYKLLRHNRAVYVALTYRYLFIYNYFKLFSCYHIKWFYSCSGDLHKSIAVHAY